MKNKLKIQRAIKDITQEQLAAAVGVSRQTINALEKGKYIPSTLLALKIAKYFETKVEAVFILEPEDLKGTDIN